MNVAIIHYRLVHMGGLETRFLNYIKYFKKHGHNVTIIYSKISKDVKLPEGVEQIKVNLGFMPKKFRTWYFNKKLKKLEAINNFDMVLSLGRTGNQTAVLAPCTHLGFMKALDKTNYNTKDKIEIGLDEDAYANSKQIYACSKMTADEIVDLYDVTSDKIKILYPPLNTDDYYPLPANQKKDLKNKYGMDNEKTSLLFVSTSHKRKGLPVLLKAMELLKDEPIELCVIGDSISSSLKNVKYLGYHKNIREIYNAADFLVHPSMYEPFGQIISEAIQCGTPVLVSTAVGAKEIITPEIGLVIDSLDPAVWAEEIRNLKNKKFTIKKDVLKPHNIYLEDHMAQMLKYSMGS